VQAVAEGAGDQVGEEPVADQHGAVVGRQRVQRTRTQQVLDRVVAEEGGEQDRHRRQRRHPCGGRVVDAVRLQPRLHGCGQRGRQADDHQREEDAHRQHLGRVLKGLVHAAAGAAVAGRQAVHDGGSVGRGEQPHRDAVQEQHHGERGIREVGRKQHQKREAERRADHACGGEPAGAEAV